MTMTNVNSRGIVDMEKHALQKGNDPPKNRKRVGKIEFVVSGI